MDIFYYTVYGKKTAVLCTYAVLVVNSRNTNIDLLQILLVTTKLSDWLHWLEVIDSWFWLCRKQSKNAYYALMSLGNIIWRKSLSCLPVKNPLYYSIIKWDNNPLIFLCMDVTRKTRQSSIYFKIWVVGNILCSVSMLVFWFFVHSMWKASKLDCFVDRSCPSVWPNRVVASIYDVAYEWILIAFYVEICHLHRGPKLNFQTTLACQDCCFIWRLK
jgi:hypothetical protein